MMSNLQRTVFVLKCFYFFFNDTATTEIYTLSLHDALPISTSTRASGASFPKSLRAGTWSSRSEEHTSELQSRGHLVCRLLLEKQKRIIVRHKPNKKYKNQRPQQLDRSPP